MVSLPVRQPVPAMNTKAGGKVAHLLDKRMPKAVKQQVRPNPEEPQASLRGQSRPKFSREGMQEFHTGRAFQTVESDRGGSIAKGRKVIKESIRRNAAQKIGPELTICRRRDVAPGRQVRQDQTCDQQVQAFFGHRMPPHRSRTTVEKRTAECPIAEGSKRRCFP